MIPRPPGQPLVGNIFSVNAESPLQSLMQIAREQGPIFELDMMGKPMVIVSGAELVKELCDERRFDKSVRGPLRRVRAVAGDGLFTADTPAPNWSKAHNILLPSFAHKAMVNYFPMMVDIATQLVQKWERLNADDEIDVVRDMTGLALDTIGVCGFGFRFNSFYRRDFHPFIDALTRTLETCMLQRGLPFEQLVLRKRMEQLQNDVAYMNNLVDAIIRERRHGGGDESQKDLLSYMLTGVDKVTGESLSDENIRYQINTFLIAGHETTSGLLSFTLYFLLNDANVLERAYAEVDRVLGYDVSRTPTFRQISQLKYIRAILSESLRLWPTAPAIGLAPYEDEVIGGEYALKKNTMVTLLTLMLHRDESVWGENAETFDPENFSDKAQATRPDYAYKPFGNGQRACIGRQFAVQEASLVIAMILQRFKLFDHKNYELKIRESLSIKPDGFTIKVKPRSSCGATSVADASTPEAAVSRTPKVAQRAKHGTPLCVLFGSNLGSTESFAREIAQTGELHGFETTLATLDDFAGELPSAGAVIIATSSYNGLPPDNAARFIDWLNGATSGAAQGVSYALFGCGSRDWAATFQSVPRHIDARLAELGATRIVTRGESDAREDLDGQFQAWAEALWPAVGKALDLAIDFTAPAEVEPLYEIQDAASVTANPIADGAGAITMTVVRNRELLLHDGDPNPTRSTRHIELELPEGVTYQPGDHLCVIPVNRDELVARILDRFNYDENSYIRVHATRGRRSPFADNSTFSVKRLADVYGELQAVASRKDVAMLAQYTQCPRTKKALAALANDANGQQDVYRQEVFLKRKSVFDLLLEFPACELPFAVYLEMMPWLSPRYYSISSAQSTNPRRCSITVGVVSGPARSGTGDYHGVCSTYLREAQVGATLKAVVKQPTNEFRLPDDPGRAIIMVAAGTGLAPFRGFLQERERLRRTGRKLGTAMLFFGCRHPQQDFLYREELQAAERADELELHVAFSRFETNRIYVQDLMKQQQDRVWQLLHDGAIVYVCGDGVAMEPDVRRAITAIYVEQNDASFEDAQLWMESFAKDGRYVLDVWAGG
jgi:cytochrome P450/NADPH-cytochrome P450 reductase